MKTIMNFDHDITVTINSWAGRFLSLDYSAIFFAKFVIFFLVFAIAATWFIRTNQTVWRFHAISCGMAVALGLLLNQVILQFFSRLRPYDLGLTHLIVEKSADPSFPSDHATLVFAIAFTLLLMRNRLAVSYLILAALVALARVFIGTHFFSDVIGGAVTALIAAIAVTNLYKPNLRLNKFLVGIF